jgi:hypothetical protein
MKMDYIKKFSRYLIVAFLLFGSLLVQMAIPIQINAQGKKPSIFSNNPQSDPNDDEKLCAAGGTLANDKFCTYFKGYNDNVDTNKPQAIEYRNRMIDLLKYQIDEYYDAHIHGRVVKTKWFQTVLDILGIGLSFSGNIVGGLRSKTVLAATAGSFQAGRNSVNDRFALLQQQILINKMNSNRLNQWAAIVAKKNDGVNGNEYSWDSAKADLQHYLFLGSFTNALDSLVEQTGAQVQNAQTNLNVVLKSVNQTTLAAKLQNFSGYIVPMYAMAGKLDSDITAKQLEVDAARLAAGIAVGAALPVPIPQAIAAKIAEKTALEAKKASLLENYKNIFFAIKVSGDFTVIDQKVKATYGGNAAVMTPYDKVFNNIQTNPSVITQRDYDFALATINEFAGEDAEMNKRFLAILLLYKI